MDKQLRLRLRIIAALVVLWLFSNLYFFLVKLGGFALLLHGLVQLTLFVCFVIWSLILVWRTISSTDWQKSANYATIIAIPVLYIVSDFESLHADENTFQSKVTMRACYEGTVNTSRLFLREGGEFEDFNIGFFGIVNYMHGRWKMTGDTIELSSPKLKDNRLLGRKLIFRDSILYRVEQDTLVSTSYYMGECKGFN